MRRWIWIAALTVGCGATLGSSEDEGARQKLSVGGGQAGPPVAPPATETLGYSADDAAPEPEEPSPMMDQDEGRAISKLATTSRPGKKDEEKGGRDGESGERTREWFPESFLWQPLVQTDAEGRASLDVRVPDQLTTWRVLALAHTRQGTQAGTVKTFESTMPVYVQPVIPGWLYAGDTIDLPIQVVNTTRERIDARLFVDTDGPLTGAGASSVSLGAGGSDVKRIGLRASGAGMAHVEARIEGVDAARREIRVVPTGRPVQARRGGTLAAERSFQIATPAGADPSTQELVVLVFPGPLSVMQAEVERIATAGGTPYQAAYGFALAHHLTGLAADTGAELDPKTVSRLQAVAWQRLVRHMRAPDHGLAADLLTALADAGDHELAAERARTLVRIVEDGQRSDGSWPRAQGGTLQTMVVQTAVAARSLPATSTGPRVRASGVFERSIREIDDAYTAAVVLSTGLVEGALATKLRELVVNGTVVNDDGSRTVSVPADVRNAWGSRPSTAEMLAWTVLALADQDVAWRGDLVSELMAGYDASRGFGAGPADVYALEAVARSLPGITAATEVELSLDGKVVDRARLDPGQPLVPAVLRAEPGASKPRIGLRTVGDTPGLAFVATQRSWVPWPDKVDSGAVEVEVSMSRLEVGRDGWVQIAIAAPAGVGVTVEQGLPSGTVVDEARLASAGLDAWQVTTDRVRFTTSRFTAGETKQVRIPVQPAFAGTFSTVPMSVELAGAGRYEARLLRPARWTVR